MLDDRTPNINFDTFIKQMNENLLIPSITKFESVLLNTKVLRFLRDLKPEELKLFDEFNSAFI